MIWGPKRLEFPTHHVRMCHQITNHSLQDLGKWYTPSGSEEKQIIEVFSDHFQKASDAAQSKGKYFGYSDISLKVHIPAAAIPPDVFEPVEHKPDVNMETEFKTDDAPAKTKGLYRHIILVFAVMDVGQWEQKLRDIKPKRSLGVLWGHKPQKKQKVR